MIELFGDDDDPVQLEVESRLRELKADPHGLLERFDTNGDGTLDTGEWRAIRSVLTRQVAGEQQGREAVDEPLTLVADRYQVLSKIRPGAQGVASLARDQTTGELVVIKVMRLNHVDSWHQMERFHREPRILGALEDHRIPMLIDAFEVKGDEPGYVVVQTYVEGEDLEVAMARGALFDEETIVDIARQTLRLLAFLHAQKPAVIHRDVKPSNLIVDPQGQIHLVDFGGALRAGEAVAEVIATPGYAAPEQVMGRPSEASDLYGLGATLVHLATGRAPESLEVDRMVLQWRHLANLSPRTASAIDRLIQPDDRKRFQTANDAEEALATGMKVADIAQETQLTRVTGGAAPALVSERPLGSDVRVRWNPQGLRIEVPKHIGRRFYFAAAGVVLAPVMAALSGFKLLGGVVVLLIALVVAAIQWDLSAFGRQVLLIEKGNATITFERRNTVDTDVVVLGSIRRVNKTYLNGVHTITFVQTFDRTTKVFEGITADETAWLTDIVHLYVAETRND